MKVTVRKNGVVHDCTSEEQLKRFLAAGWVKCRPAKPTEPEKDGETADEE